MYEHRSVIDIKDDLDEDHLYENDQLPTAEEIRIQAASCLKYAEQVNKMHSRRLSVASEMKSIGGFSARGILKMPRISKMKDQKLIVWAGIIIVMVTLFSLIIAAFADVSKEKKIVLPLDREEVENYLMQIGLVTVDDLKDETSIQSLTIDWLTEIDAARIAVPLASLNEPNTFFLQRYILVLFFIATQGQGGGWSHNWDFLHAEKNICSWNEEIEDVDGTIQIFGAQCDANGILRKLDIPRSNLFGRIPREIGYLTNLNHLALDYNKLTGYIPPEVQYLLNCRHLSLQGNELGGQLPNFLGMLTNLSFLGLGQNLLEGAIPESYQSLTNLVTLGLNHNILQGTFGNLATLLKMKRLYLDSNSFEERLEIVEFKNMIELEELDLSHNQLSGSIPDEIFDYPNLLILDLSDNKLSGDLPNKPHDDSSLKVLSLNHNNLTGDLKKSIFKMKNLMHLNLATNELSGHIPDFIENLTNLRYLSLSNNPLESSPIPAELAALTRLEEISFKRSNRKGTIPNYFFKFSNLVMLDLEDNNLSGSIPEELGELSELEFLALNQNENISGTLPASIQALPRLAIILMDKTSLSGNLNGLCDRFDGSKKKTAIEVAGADCLSDGREVEVLCDCCTICCHDERTSAKCSKNDNYRVLENGWRNSYKNKEYEFSKNLIGNSA